MIFVPGTKKVNLGPSWKNIPKEVWRGYYIVFNDKNGVENRVHIGFDVEGARNTLDADSDKYLGPHNGYNYSIEFCHGVDVRTKGPAWSNLDHTDEIVE